MEGEYELVCDLSNGAISNDLERTLTLFSRSHHSLTLNILQTARPTDTVIAAGLDGLTVENLTHSHPILLSICWYVPNSFGLG